MRFVIEFLFPKRLTRLSYFLRVMLCQGVSFYLLQDSWGETTAGTAALVAVLAYTGFFVVLPRIRDLGMHGGWTVLAFIPYVSAFLSAALLFRRTKQWHNPHLQRPPGAPLPSQPDTAAGPEGV